MEDEFQYPVSQKGLLLLSEKYTNLFHSASLAQCVHCTPRGSQCICALGHLSSHIAFRIPRGAFDFNGTGSSSILTCYDAWPKQRALTHTQAHAANTLIVCVARVQQPFYKRAACAAS